MFLLKEKRKKGIHLCIAHAYRDPITKKSKRKRIQNIGYLEELQKKYEDPIAHFTAVAKEMTETYKRKEHPADIILDFLSNIESEETYQKNFGYVALSSIYHDLKIDQFFSNRQRTSLSEYGLNSMMKIILFSQILYPRPILNVASTAPRFFEIGDFSNENIFDFFRFLNQNRAQLKKWIHDNICDTIGRHTDTVYYYATNHYFEIDYHKWYAAKRDLSLPRPDPIVQMGLFVDSNRIPITYELFKQKTHDVPLLGLALKLVRDDFKIDRVIIVSDNQNASRDHFYIAANSGHGYIVNQSIRDSDRATQSYVLNEDDYISLGRGRKIKSCTNTKNVSVTMNNGKKTLIRVTEKQVVLFDANYARWATAMRESFMLMANDLLSENSWQFSKIVRNNPNEIKSTTLMKEEILDGYYMFYTSEVDMDDEDIVNAFEDYWEINDVLREKNSNYHARPNDLPWSNHLSAYFLIRFVSLVITRVLEKTSGMHHHKDTILDCLKKCTCVNIGQNIFMTTYTNQLLNDIGKSINVDFSKRYRTLQEIKGMLNNAHQFDDKKKNQ